MLAVLRDVRKKVVIGFVDVRYKSVSCADILVEIVILAMLGMSVRRRVTSAHISGLAMIKSELRCGSDGVVSDRPFRPG